MSFELLQFVMYLKESIEFDYGEYYSIEENDQKEVEIAKNSELFIKCHWLIQREELR